MFDKIMTMIKNTIMAFYCSINPDKARRMTKSIFNFKKSGISLVTTERKIKFIEKIRKNLERK